MKRILSVLASAVILLPAALMLGGCGEAAGNNVETDQLPYGATVTIDTSRDITMSYDARFIEPELADKVKDGREVRVEQGMWIATAPEE